MAAKWKIAELLTFATTSWIFVENFFSAKPLNSVIILGLNTPASEILFWKNVKKLQEKRQISHRNFEMVAENYGEFFEEGSSWEPIFPILCHFWQRRQKSDFPGSISFRCAKNQTSKGNFRENDVDDLTLAMLNLPYSCFLIKCPKFTLVNILNHQIQPAFVVILMFFCKVTAL